MAQVTSSLQIPSSISWDNDGKQLNRRGKYLLKAEIYESMTTLYLTWTSSCSTFQVQWRRRRRYSPAKALAVSSSGADVWEEWGEWEGSDLSGDAAIAATNDHGAIWALDEPFEIPYEFSEYDLWEYQVRVRVLDASSLACSEWAYETLRAAFMPQWEYGSATRNADGSVTLEVNHNMTRPCSFKLGELKSSTTLGAILGITKTIGKMNEKVALPAGGGTVVIPANIIGSYKSIKTPNAQLTSYDAAIVPGVAGLGFTVGQVSEDESITAPAATFEDTDLSTCVAVADAGYDNVFVTAEWEDAYGNPHVESLDVAGAWEAELFAPPYGVEIAYRITAAKGATWRTSTFLRTLNRRWTHMSFVSEDGETVVIRYKTTRKVTASVEGEAVKCAGRKNPVARHGMGGASKIVAEGKILDPMYSAGGAWLPDIEKLRSNKTWIYRDPEGRRMRVMVKSVATSSQTTSGPRGIVDVSISMTEVE